MYPLTEKLKERLAEVVQTDADQDLVDSVVEAFGELEHDTSLVWPEMFEGLDGLTDDDVDLRMATVEHDLERGVDVVIEVIGYVIEGRRTD